MDAHGCVLKDSVKITFNVIDTVAPTITKMGDTVSAPAYANCEYIIPDVRGYIVASDNCIISDTIQVPAAGQHVTTDTIVVVTVIDSCGNTASDTIRVNLPVHTLPHVEWASLDNDVVTDSLMFCPTDLEHMVVATVTGGQPNYKNIHWTGYAGTATYNADKSSDTLRFTLPGDCGRTYTVGIDNLLDTNGCALENTIELTFFVNDTVKPHVSKTINDTVSAPSYANCEYVLPDLRSFITVTDGCDTIADTIQVPAAGQLVTTDTIVRIIVHDLCGNADTVAIDVNLPVEQLAFDTIKVTKTVECAGDANGAIRIVVKNGNPPYDVRIQSVENTSIVDSLHGTADQVAFDFTGLVKGKWNITVTDTNGCQIYAPDTADVASPNVLTLVITDSVNLTCYGSENGAITYRVSQGTAPYSMTIAHTFNSVTDTLSPSPLVLHPSALDTIVEMTNLKAGEYVITVEDSNHCKDVKTVTLTQPDSLKLEGVTVLNHVKCFGDSLGNLAVTGVTGGTYPYHYAWVNTAGDTVNTDSVTGRKIPYGIDGIYTMYVAHNGAPHRPSSKAEEAAGIPRSAPWSYRARVDLCLSRQSAVVGKASPDARRQPEQELHRTRARKDSWRLPGDGSKCVQKGVRNERVQVHDFHKNARGKAAHRHEKVQLEGNRVHVEILLPDILRLRLCGLLRPPAQRRPQKLITNSCASGCQPCAWLSLCLKLCSRRSESCLRQSPHPPSPRERP